MVQIKVKSWPEKTGGEGRGMMGGAQLIRDQSEFKTDHYQPIKKKEDCISVDWFIPRLAVPV